MEFSIKSGSPEKQRTACVVIGVFEARKLSMSAEILDKISRGYISEIVRRGDMEGRLGTTLLLHKIPHLLCDRVLLVGLGREREFHDKEYRNVVRIAVKTLNETGASEAVMYFPELPIKKRDTAWKIFQAVIVAHEATYRFEQLKSKPDDVRKPLKKLTLAVARRSELDSGETALQQGVAVAHGMELTKNLGNLPGNICTPTYLAQQAQELGKTFNFPVDVYEKKDIEKFGMGSFLSVARGSHQPPKLIVLRYEGIDKRARPIVLVGKGITFDTGGISIKPSAEMDEMKFDMCGAGSVLGAFRAVAELRLPVNLVGIIPTTENMPGGNASRPGDVVKTMSGQTVEILNTDAEGRLILCDALTFAERFNPEVVIDIATLTGACVIALGHVVAGLFSNDDTFARELLQAGEQAYDRAWQLPLWDDYQEQLHSNFADMANIGGRPAGSITAACFLSRFTKAYRWAHIDIAGVAYKSGKEKGATARPVPLLTTFLIQRAHQRKSKTSASK